MMIYELRKRSLCMQLQNGTQGEAIYLTGKDNRVAIVGVLPNHPKYFTESSGSNESGKQQEGKAQIQKRYDAQLESYIYIVPTHPHHYLSLTRNAFAEIERVA